MELLAGLGRDVLSSLVLGLVVGTIYGLIGLGIVLIYKAQRVINFAQAELATFGAFMLLVFHEAAGLPYVLAGLLAVAAAVVASVLVERVVIRPLRDSPDVTVFVATAGVALFVIALTFVISGANIRIVDPMFGGLEGALEGRGLLALFSPQRLLVIGLLVVSGVALTLFFSRTALGKALLAMSAEPFAVRLAGVSTDRMSMLVWAMAGLVAGAVGVAYAPTTALLPGLFTTQALIPALTAVVIGGLTSLTGAFAGGLAIGFITELASRLAPPAVPEPGTIAVFTILLLTLLFRPQGLLAREA